MGIADELEKLDQLRLKGSLTEEEFAQAKSQLLSNVQKSGEAQSLLEGQLTELRHQNELAQLDREWQIEQRRYQVAGSYRVLYVPTVSMGLVIAISGSLFGLFWIATAYYLPEMINAISPVAWQFINVSRVLFVIGTVITVVSLARGLILCVKAIAYQRAYLTYVQKCQRISNSP
jgi:hypothetical protein